MSRTVPPLPDLATELERLAAEIRRDGTNALRMARLLEDRGWPTTSGAAGNGSRGSSELTATEAAASRPNPWDGTRDKLYASLSETYKAACNLRDTIGLVMGHGDVDATERHRRQPGSGPCLACTKDVPGTENDRLRSGFCNACRMAYQRAGRPDRPRFIRERMAELAPPEPEHVDPTQPIKV